MLVTDFPEPGDRQADGLGPASKSAQELVEFANGRCGYGERVHDDLKNGLAGGRMPCGRFGSNAAWWQATVLSANVHRLMARWALQDTELEHASWKRVRAALPVHAVFVLGRSRRYILRLREAGTEMLRTALERIEPPPPAPA